MVAVLATGLVAAVAFAPEAGGRAPAYFLEMDPPFRSPPSGPNRPGPGAPSGPSPFADPLPPVRIWLLDGFNLLHASLGRESRDEWWKSDRRARLVARAAGLRASCEEIWVVFDGDDPEPGARDPERTRTVFAASADDWIVKRVREAPDPSAIAVVTGDKQVASRARHRGAEVVSPRWFLAHCPDPTPS